MNRFILTEIFNSTKNAIRSLIFRELGYLSEDLAEIVYFAQKEHLTPIEQRAYNQRIKNISEKWVTTREAAMSFQTINSIMNKAESSCLDILAKADNKFLNCTKCIHGREKNRKICETCSRWYQDQYKHVDSSTQENIEQIDMSLDNNDELFCPICGSEIFVQKTKGKKFALIHDKTEKQCPLSNHDEAHKNIGMFLYDTEKEALDAWIFKREKKRQ